MLWVFLALLAALSVSVRDVLNKKLLKNEDEYVIMFFSVLLTVLLLFPLLFFLPFPSLNSQFWSALIISGSINCLGIILSLKAFKHSDLSLSVPLITFTPLFLLITSPLILGEFPSVFGLMGILFIVCGAYLLNISEIRKGFMEPFKSLIKEKGPRYILAVAFLWSISSNFDKIGVLNSSPLFWVIALNIFVLFLLVPFAVKKRVILLKHIKNIPAYIPISMLSVVAFISQMIAISIALVPYVIALKRTSVIMSVFFGHTIFKEKGLRERLLGGIIMFAGVVLIAFS